MSDIKTVGFDAALREAFESYSAVYYAAQPDDPMAPFPFSELFEAKVQRLIRRERKPWYVLVNTVGKRVAAILIAVLVGITATTFSVEALREPVLDFFMQIFDTHSVVSFPAEPNKPPHGDESVVKSVFVPAEPTYIPEGYSEIERIFTTELHRIVYKNERGFRLVYTQHRKSSTAENFNSDDYTVVSINGHDGVCYIAYTDVYVVFSDDTYTYTVCNSALRSEEKTIRMAESIRAIPEDTLIKYEFVPMAPTYIPEGFTLKERSIRPHASANRLVYTDEKGRLLVYSQHAAGGNNSINTEHGYEIISVNGNNGVLYYTSDDDAGVIFGDGVYTYSVDMFGEKAKSEVLRIAESIAPVSSEAP